MSQSWSAGRVKKVVRKFTVLSLVVVGCGDHRESEPAVRRSAAASPTDAPYSIVDTDTLPGGGHSLVVRLSEKFSEGTLLAISYDLKAQDPRRTFVAYYLPNMQVSSRAWATVDLEKALTVQVLGPTVADVQQMADRPAIGNRQVIGRWLDNSPIVGGPLTIFLEGGRPFLERHFKDGSTLKRRLVERRSPSGRRFDVEAERTGTGDHFIIARNGNLQIRDNVGVIQTAQKITAQSP